MRSTSRIAALGFVSIATSVAVGAAEPPAYKVSEEIVVTGRVVSVSTIPDWMGKDGLNIALQGPALSVPHIDVATASFMKLVEFPIAVGDDLDLTGCWSKTGDGQAVFLVHTLKKSRVTLNVRDTRGAPLW